MGNRKPYSIDEQLRGAVSKLKYHVAEPYYGWSELPLQMRSTLVAKVLPEIEALKDETLNTRREHLVRPIHLPQPLFRGFRASR